MENKEEKNIIKKVSKKESDKNQINFVKDVVIEIAGINASEIVGLLFDKSNVNEFLIAKKLNITINQTRNILYKLGDQGLVSFIRKKDKKNGGWYTYFWTLNTEKSILMLQKKLVSKIDQYNHNKNNLKTKRYYYSPEADIEYSEESALEHNFICPETGDVMILKDNATEIDRMKNEINQLDEKLDRVKIEINTINVKKEAATIRRRINEEKIKKEEKELRRKERERLKKIELKKSGKLVPKKVKKKIKKKVPKKKVKKLKKVPKKKVKKLKKVPKKKVIKKKKIVKKKKKK